jgi:Zeta toxin
VVAAIHRQPEYVKARAEAAKHTDALVEGEWEDNDTRRFYGGSMESPDWSKDPTRAALHTAAVALMFKGVKPQPEGKRDALFMAGGGASGKSSLLRQGLVREPENNTISNADIFKDALPDTDLIRHDESRPDEERRKAAAKVHEESSMLGKLHLRTAMARRCNFIMDGTGDGKQGKFVGQLEEARKRGYNARVAYVTTYVGDALSRNEPRFQKEGRYVSPEVLVNAHTSAARAFVSDVLPSDFPVEVWDTTVKGRPKKIYERTEGKGEGAGKILDAAAFTRFKARAERPDFNPANAKALTQQIERLAGIEDPNDAEIASLKALRALKAAEH